MVTRVPGVWKAGCWKHIVLSVEGHKTYEDKASTGIDAETASNQWLTPMGSTQAMDKISARARAPTRPNPRVASVAAAMMMIIIIIIIIIITVTTTV